MDFPAIASSMPSGEARISLHRRNTAPMHQTHRRFAMNIVRLSLAILTLAAANSFAAQDTTHTALNSITVHDNARIVVDCQNERIPSQRAVADLLDTNNASRIHAEREHLIHIAHRECLRGSRDVAFVRDGSPTLPALAMVDPTKSP